MELPGGKQNPGQELCSRPGDQSVQREQEDRRLRENVTMKKRITVLGTCLH